MKLTRTQAEAALLVAGVFALLWLYRSFLDRSLAAQQVFMAELLAERERDQQAATNGHLDPEHVAVWLREHPDDYSNVLGMMQNMAAGDPPTAGGQPDA